jgi:putative ABC transport system ATP-binding protein
VALIEIRNLTKLYRMGDAVVRALDGVDLSIQRGEFIAITGASGSGKSTMMHLLGCLDRPTAGSYLLDGRDVSELADADLAAIRNKKIGFVFQTFNLINRTTAAENVGVPLFYARQTNTKVPSLRALERVGLSHRAGHLPNEMSGGERQRVAIARAIVNDPVLVLADEPTGNLDSRTGEQIMEIFHALNEQGVTIVIVTHEPDIAEQAKRIVHMRDGKIVSDRVTADILAEEQRPRVATRVIVEAAQRSAEVSSASATATLLRPAAPVPPAAAVEHRAASDLPLDMPARLVSGATAGLVCSLSAVLCWVLIVGISVLLSRMYPELSKPTGGPPKMPPTGVMVGGVAMLILVPAGLTLAILGVVFSVRARRRMRSEIGNWLGRKRSLAGLIIGWAALVVPVGWIAISIVMGIIKLKAGTG